MGGAKRSRRALNERFQISYCLGILWVYREAVGLVPGHCRKEREKEIEDQEERKKRKRREREDR